MSSWIDRLRQKSLRETKKITEGYGYKEWRSPDGKYEIVISNAGGEEYDNIYMKDVRLLLVTDVGKCEMMRVQAVTEPNEQVIRYNVYLDALTKNDNSGYFLTDICYFAHDNGVISEPASWSYPTKRGKYRMMPDEEFEEYFRKEVVGSGIYTMEQIPHEINIEETVKAFINQIKSLDFSKPRLIPKPGRLRG